MEGSSLAQAKVVVQEGDEQYLSFCYLFGGSSPVGDGKRVKRVEGFSLAHARVVVQESD